MQMIFAQKDAIGGEKSTNHIRICDVDVVHG